MNTSQKFAMPNLTLIALIYKNPKLLIPAVPIVKITELVVDFESIAWVLLGLFVTDLVTGLLASYFIWKKSDHKERWFFGKGEGFSSDKAKKMGAKALIYLGVPYLCIELQKIIYLKNFKYEKLSDAEFELATIWVIIFCGVEIFSIVCENAPKIGFDLIAYIKKIINGIKCLKNDVKDLKE